MEYSHNLFDSHVDVGYYERNSSQYDEDEALILADLISVSESEIISDDLNDNIRMKNSNGYDRKKAKTDPRILRRRKCAPDLDDPRPQVMNRMYTAINSGITEDIRNYCYDSRTTDSLHVERYLDDVSGLVLYRELPGPEQFYRFIMANLAVMPDVILRPAAHNFYLREDGSSYIVGVLYIYGTWIYKFTPKNIVHTSAYLAAGWNPFKQIWNRNTIGGGEFRAVVSAKDQIIVDKEQLKQQQQKQQNSSNNSKAQGLPVGKKGRRLIKQVTVVSLSCQSSSGSSLEDNANNQSSKLSLTTEESLDEGDEEEEEDQVQQHMRRQLEYHQPEDGLQLATATTATQQQQPAAVIQPQQTQVKKPQGSSATASKRKRSGNNNSNNISKSKLAHADFNHMMTTRKENPKAPQLTRISHDRIEICTEDSYYETHEPMDRAMKLMFVQTIICYMNLEGKVYRTECVKRCKGVHMTDKEWEKEVKNPEDV